MNKSEQYRSTLQGIIPGDEEKVLKLGTTLDKIFHQI